MYSVMLKDGFSNARANARLRIENTLDLNRLFLALDAVSLLGGVATTLTTVRMVAAVRSSTGKDLKNVLKGLSRQERVKLTNDQGSTANP